MKDERENFCGKKTSLYVCKKTIVTEKDSVIKNIDFLQKRDKIISNHD
jgi:hypothetical protein